MTTIPSLTGADPDGLERAAAELRAAAERLDGQAALLDADLGSVRWVGGVADEFADRWASRHRTQIGSTAIRLREVATVLDGNAADQRRASGRASGSSSGVPSVVPSGVPGGGSSGSTVDSRPARVEGPSDPARDLEERLAVLGIGRTAVKAITDAIGAVDDPAVGRMLELVTHPDFVKLLERSGTILDVGNFVADVFIDIGDHPDLSLDERIVHAVTDASMRFAMKEGLETASELLAASLTTALLPVAGAVVAPFVAQAAGAVAQMVLGPAVDRLDAATGAVDWAADRAVDVWRDAMTTIGVLMDVAETGVSVVTGAVDLTGDAIEWIDDQVGAAGDWVVDRAGDAVDGVVGGVGDAIGSAGGWLGL